MTHPLLEGKPWMVMGILNVTPDSFYDGGRFVGSIEKAIDQVAKMIQSGAAIIDIGGESTRPGSLPVSLEEELLRVIPVVEALHSRFDITLSIDTTKSTIAEAALQCGAHWINDVSAGRFDKNMASVVALHSAVAVLMHSRKAPQNMQKDPFYQDTISEVYSELLEQALLFQKAGVSKDNIILDPGIGFAKRLSDNLLLLKEANAFLRDGYPLLIGTSRKSFLGNITGKESGDRLASSLATISATYMQGASLFRVHDVPETVDFLKTVDAIESGEV